MTDSQAIALPKLPESQVFVDSDGDAHGALIPSGSLYTADQMHAYLIADRAARAQTPGEPAGWQPIETAPRDGTGILALWVHEGDSVTARNYALVEFVRGCWRDTESDDQVYTEPTYWMPLPAAPTAQAPSAASQVETKAEAVRVLWEEIGTYSVQCAKTGELAPSRSLVEAVDHLASLAASPASGEAKVQP